MIALSNAMVVEYAVKCNLFDSDDKYSLLASLKMKS